MTDYYGVAHAPTTDYGRTMYRIRHESRCCITISRFTEASNDWNHFEYKHYTDSNVNYRQLGEAVRHLIDTYDVELDRVVVDPSVENELNTDEPVTVDGQEIEKALATHLTIPGLIEEMGLADVDVDVDFSRVTIIDCRLLVEGEDPNPEVMHV